MAGIDSPRDRTGVRRAAAFGVRPRAGNADHVVGADSDALRVPDSDSDSEYVVVLHASCVADD
ncbi:hypothetical protein GCM10017690_11430 [Microbacterium terregens]